MQDAIQRFSDRVDFSVLSQVVNTIVFLEKGVVTKIFDVGFTIKVPEGMGSEMHIRPVTTVTDSETGRLVLDIFRYDGQTIVIPVFESTSATPASRIPQVPQIQSIGQPVSHVNKPGSSLSAIPDATPRAPTDERPGWKLTEKEIQREIGRYTDGAVEVEMISDTKAVVYIDDKDVPAAIGKGGKNVSAIVNKIGIGIDIKPRSDLDRQQAQPQKPEGEFSIGSGIKIQTDKSSSSSSPRSSPGR